MCISKRVFIKVYSYKFLHSIGHLLVVSFNTSFSMIYPSLRCVLFLCSSLYSFYHLYIYIHSKEYVIRKGKYIILRKIVIKKDGF